MTDEELDGYLVLMYFMLKKKNPCSEKKLKKILFKVDIQKESSVRTLQQFSAWTANRGLGVLFQVSFLNDIFGEISKL